MQAIGHAGDQVAGAHQGGHAHLALQHQQDDQNVAQDLDGHADKAHRAVSRAFAAAEVAGGLLNLVAGLTSLAQKAPLLSKKAQHIQAGQQVLERADARRLPLGAQPSQLLQPLLKQLWQRPHDERRHKRSCHQRPVQAQQHHNAPKYLGRPAHAVKKGVPGQLFDLFDIVGHPGKVLAAVLLVVVLVALLQQLTAQVVPQVVVERAHHPCLG